MTDKELLELAAKAAGYEIRFYDYGNGRYEGVRRVTENVHVIVWTSWNPLTDDGDALRLACKLMIQVIQDRFGFVKVGWSVGFESGTPIGHGPWYWKEWLSDHNGNREAATRRAITRAAAEIGKSL